MRSLATAAFAALALSAVLAGPASASAQFHRSSHHPAVGYQDEDGTFHPLAKVEPDAATSTTVTGTITVNFRITIKTALPSGTKVFCGADLEAESISEAPPGSSTHAEEAASEATSSTACSVTINYSWTIFPTGATVENLLSGSYTVIATNPSIPTLAEAVGSRESTGTLPGLVKIPLTGTKTTIDVNVTL